MSKEELMSHRFLYGGLSCMAAACVTNPIDVIKTRLQLQGELIAKGNIASAAAGGEATAAMHYKGFTRGTIQIIKDEGIIALYKGLSPSLLREASYSTIRMGGYDLIKNNFVDQQTGNITLLSKIISGAISGSVGACIANPSDLIKVRMQAKSGQHRYTSISTAFISIVREEGWRGLYKGTVPTTQRAALLTASQLSSYDHIKHTLIDAGYAKEGFLAHTISSIGAGLVAATFTSPVDLVKTRIMNQPVDSRGVGTLYTSTLDCFTKTFKAEGPLGLYKGFIPNWLRIGPHSLVTFIVYEQLRKIGGINPI
ncbi:mitochondrial substrate carrier family protein [Cavenderia fasciculata]|uniref:Mitochondrial substrate carrier family protein n=1 Tax=Cavenderia fasciculata TaxID=261658 RepID=F4Q3K2_CACFS|nr:mitochondrial substrate carrier family protein [Cavenderia fasciculata]EGG17660.1 mitochondrial substrate carrier family protein [Cavenderia fasciculata]|eukprot:XP_004356144.1 mitochondrial substrate carrier family protein [Cavenderia fasciculata]